MQQSDDLINRISKDIERRKELEREKNMLQEEKKSSNQNVSGTVTIGNPNSVKSVSVESEIIPSTGLQKQSMTLQEEISVGMNSIDSTVRDLRSYMTGMFADQPDPTVQKMDVFRVETAVDCAKTINELLKTKIEAIKVAKDVYGKI